MGHKTFDISTFFFFNLRGVSHQEPILVGVFFLGVDRIISIETERQKYELSDAFQPWRYTFLYVRIKERND